MFLGAGVPVHGPVTPGNRRWHAEDVPPGVFDQDRARRLLSGLGLSDRDGDGVLDDAAGEPVRFALLTQKGHTSRERGSAVIQEDLRKVGIQVDVVALDPGALIGRFGKADYDAIYFGTAASDTDPAVNLDFWLSSGPFHIWNPGQPTPATEWERRIDELMHAQVASQDQTERKRLFDDVQRIFAERLPVLYFVAPRVIVATSGSVSVCLQVVIRCFA